MPTYDIGPVCLVLSANFFNTTQRIEVEGRQDFIPALHSQNPEQRMLNGMGHMGSKLLNYGKLR